MNVLYVLSRYAFISSFFSLLCLLKQYQTGNMKTTTDNKKRILFICLGNICRSPAAHAVMQHMVDERGLSSQYEIDSAGIGGWHIGQLPDKRMREHGNRRGYRIDHHARQFDSSVDFDRFDHIIVMDEDNFRNITSQTTDEKARTKVLRMADFFTEHPHATCVPDPYYGGSADFELALDLIEDGCRGLLTL
jgi:protein-tyrosine phosphatase